MHIITLIFALLTSTIFIIFYINIYRKYFEMRMYSYIGKFMLLLSVYIQLFAIYLQIDIRIIALLSFFTYPLSILLIFKTNYLNNFFLSLNAILKIYAAFIFFGALFAVFNNIQYNVQWITTSPFYNLAQGAAYLLSIGSLIIVDNYMIKEKLKFFFKLKSNLLLVSFIQIILLLNLIWISTSNTLLPQAWYNNSLLIIALSVDIIYFLLRLYIANSSYYITFMTHTETLKKQLDFQIEHYKNYEEQANELIKFKHDYTSILTGIANLIQIEDYRAANNVIGDALLTLKHTTLSYYKYSNNIILDALLNDYAQRFERIGAKFSARSYIEIPNLNELDLIRLFNNILENAYEALLKHHIVSERTIEINTTIINDYVKISFKNTMSDKETNTMITSKNDKLNHGFGLVIINEIIAKYNGFSNVYTSSFAENQTYYNLEIFFPKS